MPGGDAVFDISLTGPPIRGAMVIGGVSLAHLMRLSGWKKRGRRVS